MDPLLYFVIAIFWAISSWIQRRNEEKAAAEQEQEPWFPEDASARSSDRSPDRGKPVAANGWEEELRRLLEGKAPEPKPAPAPAKGPGISGSAGRAAPAARCSGRFIFPAGAV